MEQDPPTDPSSRFAAAVRARSIARRVAARTGDLGRLVPYRAGAVVLSWGGAMLATRLGMSESVVLALIALTGGFVVGDTVRPSGKRQGPS